MRLHHPLAGDEDNLRLAHSAADRMYVLGGMSDTAGNRITFERDSHYRLAGMHHTDGIRLQLEYHASGYLKKILRTDNGVETLAEYRQDAQGRLTGAIGGAFLAVADTLMAPAMLTTTLTLDFSGTGDHIAA